MVRFYSSNIPKVVIGENQTYQGPEDYLLTHGVELDIINDPECIALMEWFIREEPDIWSANIGE